MPIVYFDGRCNVCNRFVDFLIRHDQSRGLRFAPLQGTTAQKNLPRELCDELSTMVLQEGSTNSTNYTESTAAIRTLAHLGGLWVLMKLFLLVPRFLRDAVYRCVANHRYLLVGRRSTCRLPTAQERAQFLD